MAGATSKALALFSVPFLSRALGPTDYGLTDLAVATSGILVVVAMFAGDIPAARMAGLASSVGDRRRRYTEYLMAVVAVAALITVALIPFSALIAATLWSAPSASGLVGLALAIVPISAIRAALITVHRLEGQPRTFAALATFSLVAQLVLAVLFVAVGLGPNGAVFGYLIGNVFGLVLALAMTWRLLSTRFDVRNLPNVIVTGAAFLPAMVTFVAADFASRSIVADGLGQAGVGAFAVAIRISSVLALFTAAFQLAWGPRAIVRDPGTQTAARFGRVILGYAVVSGIGCLFVAALGPELVSLISGQAFIAGAGALPGLAAGAVFAGAHYIMSMGAGILARTWVVAVSAILGAVLQVLVTGLLVHPAGLAGVGLAAIVGHAGSVAVLIGYVLRVFDHRLWYALACLTGVAILCVALAGLNADPHDTLVARVLLTVVSTLAVVITTAPLVRRG